MSAQSPPLGKKLAFRAAMMLFLFLPVELCAQTSHASSTQIPCTPHTTLSASFSSPTFSEAFLHFGNKERDRIFADYGNLYNCTNVRNYGLALLGAGIIANTTMDSKFQTWHKKQFRSDFSQELSEFSKVFGEGQYFIPIMITSAISYRFVQEKWGLSDCKLGDFTDRTFRGYLVGTPTLLTLQPLLGAGRPSMGEGTSYWRPFRHANSVSGHAFMGAVPFITAAQMTDRPLVKGVFYTLSTFCAWSRVKDDAHYLSQVLLGWYLAYLSVRAVSATETDRLLPRGLTIFPVTENDSVGVGLFYQY